VWPDLWVKVSGDVVKDAAYLLSLRGVAGGYAARQRELKRLAVLYGAGYRMDVERVLRDGPGRLCCRLVRRGSVRLPWRGAGDSGAEGAG
jgi:hypothetical protein